MNRSTGLRLGIIVILCVVVIGVAVGSRALTISTLQDLNNALVQNEVQATVTAAETARASIAPTLITPTDKASYDNAAAVTLQWQWYRPLAGDEFFDLRVWRDGQPELGITWTKDPTFDLQDWLMSQQPGSFDWTVGIVKKNTDGSSTEISDLATTQQFTMSKIDMQVMDVPQGFSVSYYARLPFKSPTVITFGPDGALYALSVEGDVARLSDDDGDHFAEDVKPIYTDSKNLLDHAVGMAFRDKVLYISDGGRISTLTDSDGDGILDKLTPIVTGLPSQLWTFHSNNGIAFGPDGKLYVGVGSTSDHGPLKVKYEASILRMNPDGSDLETFATGLRNPYDLVFTPQGDLFTADNSPDNIDDTLSYFPPEEIDYIQQGKNYGFPTVFGFPPPGSDTAPPVALLPTSSASAGITYQDSDQFPADYHGLYLAEFGTETAANSVAAGIHTGRQVVFVSLTPDGHGSFTGSWQPFAVFKSGLASQYTPIDVTVGPDGALYIAEWNSGTIYRVTYTGSQGTPDTIESAAAQGETIFQSGANGAPPCATCHTTDGSSNGIAPSLAGLAKRAGSRVAGLNTDDYVRQSIMTPNAFVVPGFSAGVMYQYYAQKLTSDQINDLIAYVLSL